MTRSRISLRPQTVCLWSLDVLVEDWSTSAGSTQDSLASHGTQPVRSQALPCGSDGCRLPLASCAPASLGSLCGRVRAQGHVHRLGLVEASGGARREEEELARHEDAQRALGGGLGRDGRRGQREGEGGQR